jgi:erythromycin esterase
VGTEFTLDPRAPLDDLEPLRELIGAARVVAVGESAHYVREYHHLRHRLARFLVERMGFTSLAMESGFTEGLVVDRWIHGGEGDPAEVAEHGLTYRFGRCAEMRGLLEWMRTVNGAGGGLAYTGLDLPGDLASLLPPLDGVGAYLARVDPEAADLLARARRQAEKYAGPYTIPAFAAYREMAAADRDELTVALAELTARFAAQRPFYLARADAREYEVAGHELRLAVLLDQQLRAQAAGTALNVRDAAMAETASWLLEREPGRLLILAANTHVQRVPIRLGGVVAVPVLGSHLAADLGDDYLSIALTCGAGRTSSRRLAPDAPGGFEAFPVELSAPAEGSVEALLRADRTGPQVADLRPLRADGTGPQRIRLLESYLDQPVAEAFDLVATVPATEVTEQAAG